MIRDVCADCNNGPLSALDAYICQLYEEQLYLVVDDGASVCLRYDHDLLGRWLLKTSFNAARTNNETDSKILSRFVPFILRSESRGRFAVFAKLVSTYLLTPEEESAVDPEAREQLRTQNGRLVLEPRMLRVSRCDPALMPDVLCRMVAINSFYFYIVVPRSENILPKAWQKLRRNVREDLGGLEQLTQDSPDVTLNASGNDVLSHYAVTVAANIDRFKKQYSKDKFGMNREKGKKERR
jgi:hypothetical protein